MNSDCWGLTRLDPVSLIRSTPDDRPLFLWLTYNAPHYGRAIIEGKDDLANTPQNTCWIDPEGGALQKGRISGEQIRVRNTLAAKPEDVAMFEKTKSRKRRFFKAMVKGMDDGIGRILDSLRETGREKNTLVVFTSDQGSDETRSSAGNNRPFRGAKHTQWEGGLRIPMVVRWPDRIPAGRVSEQLGCLTDMLPTFCRLARIETKDMLIDGIDLRDALLEGKNVERDLFWYERHPAITPHRAFRRGPWKLADDQLYNLQTDLAETTDLSKKHPEKLRELKAAHAAVMKSLTPVEE